MPADTLFIYLDESGNFDFSATGTKHLVMSAVSSSNPIANLKILGALKYKLLSSGINISNFHASEDVQAVRSQVFDVSKSFSVLSAQTFWIEKSDVRLETYDSWKVYRLFGSAFAQWAKSQRETFQLDKVVLVFDKSLKAKEEIAFLSRVKRKFAKLDGSYFVYFHNVHKDFNGQIADYVAWANYVLLERGEFRPIQALPVELRSAHNLLDWLEEAAI